MADMQPRGETSLDEVIAALEQMKEYEYAEDIGNVVAEAIYEALGHPSAASHNRIFSRYSPTDLVSRADRLDRQLRPLPVPERPTPSPPPPPKRYVRRDAIYPRPPNDIEELQG